MAEENAKWTGDQSRKGSVHTSAVIGRTKIKARRRQRGRNIGKVDRKEHPAILDLKQKGLRRSQQLIKSRRPQNTTGRGPLKKTSGPTKNHGTNRLAAHRRAKDKWETRNV